jgi:hypothetical protein
MNIVRLRNNIPQYPYSVKQFRADEPQLSISSDPHPGELATYATLDPPILVCAVTLVEPPTINTRTQRLLPVEAEFVDGAWRQTWPVRDATEQEIADYDAANAPPPDWPGFQTQLLQSEAFAAARIAARQILEAELPTAEGVRLQRLLRAATALSDIGAVVLAAASQNDPSLFIGAWLILRQANLVSPEVAAGMAQIATDYHLPADLIRSLGAPEQ